MKDKKGASRSYTTDSHCLISDDTIKLVWTGPHNGSFGSSKYIHKGEIFYFGKNTSLLEMALATGNFTYYMKGKVS